MRFAFVYVCVCECLSYDDGINMIPVSLYHGAPRIAFDWTTLF